MISLHSVSKKFGNGKGRSRTILDEADFFVAENERLGIFTGVGGGKTTLINMLSGSIEPDAGDIEVAGTTSWPLGNSTFFHPVLTGEENVQLVAGALNLEAMDICNFCQEFSELGDAFYRPVGRYSSTMKAGLAYALSFAIEFDIYLADSNVGSGTESVRAKCDVMLNAIIESKTFVFVGRNLRLFERYCDSAAALVNGKIIRCDSFKQAEKLVKQNGAVQ